MTSPQKILSFIQSAGSPVNKREIASAFKLKGVEPRAELKKTLKSLEKSGDIVKHAGGGYSVPDGLPDVSVIEILDITADGEMFAALPDWNEKDKGPQPVIEVVPDRKHYTAVKERDRVLARLARQEDGVYEARIIRRLDDPKGRVLGIVRIQKRRALLQPTDKKAKFDYEIPLGELNGANEGDLAVGEIQPARGMRNKNVRIIEILGQQGDPNAISLIAAHEMGLRTEFPAPVIKESEGQKVPSLKGREDLRKIPLVTIDGADARDFDDAVFAEDTDNGGFHLIVAIADVAYYVRPGSELDKEAYERGNSTYFPDRVLPMLPEALSNDLCSLRPDEDRACLAVHMWIDDKGVLIKQKFVRGLMRSHARLTYEQVQKMYEDLRTRGIEEQKKSISPVLDSSIPPDTILNLYAAYKVLDKARQYRGALDIDLPERQILIDEKGRMTGVTKRQRLDAHKLIEEFMVLANVAAARALETKQNPKQFPCVYRIHDRPNFEKLDSVREFIQSFGLTLPKGQTIKPKELNKVLRKAETTPAPHLINMVVLRSQSQAVYSQENIGHYGLALTQYAHFTSPIRRYADLLVHRSLINAFNLGPGGMDEREIARLDETCQHISSTERNSMAAERNTVDRFSAQYMAQHVGAEFPGKISGVTRFGLFIELDDIGAEGLIPMKVLNDDFYVHDERLHALIGRRKKKIYRLGAPVTVRVVEAEATTGAAKFELTGQSLNGADIPGAPVPKRAHRKGLSAGLDRSKKRRPPKRRRK